MAAHAETWQKVLDGTDDETMKLILQLQRAEARTCDGDQPSDFEVARSLHITELELYRANRYPGSPEPTPPPSPSQIAPRSPPQQVSVPLATQPSRKRAASTEIGEQPAKVFKTTHKTTHEAAKQLTCVICLDEFDANGGLKVTCGHFYCASHLQHLFSLAMKQQVSYPPRCCKQIVPYQDASLFLDPKLAAEFSSKSVELDDTKRVYCHVASCSAYIRHADRDGTLATCPSCGMETCISCKQAKHVGDCKADTAVEGIMALAKSEAWQQCYSCERMVELSHGCNHMTCLCKAEFCYDCGVPWKDCPCPKWHEHRLLARGQQIVAREGGGNANVMVARLRTYYDCNVHSYEWVRGRATCEYCEGDLWVYIYRCRNCHVQSCNWCTNAGH